jgi:hypothetical protein
MKTLMFSTASAVCKGGVKTKKTLILPSLMEKFPFSAFLTVMVEEKYLYMSREYSKKH